MAALAECRASEGDRWKAWEKELIDRLSPKATSFFCMGFEGAVKQLSTQGYLPLGIDADFLDSAMTLSEYPPKAFDL